MSWTAYPCRWTDQTAYEAALAAAGWQAGAPTDVDLLVTGVVHVPPVFGGDEETVVTPGYPLDGWHVCVALRDRALPDGWPLLDTPPAGMACHCTHAEAVPADVPAWAAKAVLDAAGLLSAAETLAGEAGGTWHWRFLYASIWARRDVLPFAGQLGLTEAQADEMLIHAAQLG